MSAPKLTAAQRRALVLVGEGRDLHSFDLADVRGRCDYDALLWSARALESAGLIEWDRFVWRGGTCCGSHKLTPAGRAALKDGAP